MSHVAPARKAAFGILLVLERGQAHSDDLLRGNTVSALTSQDRNLATILVLGVLRWQIELDQRLHPLLKRPNAKLDAEVRIALRLAAFQLLHLDRIPARAAIDDSVELTKNSGHRFASGLVNAVLRKLATQPKADVTTEASPPRDLQAYPQWLRERWQLFFGDQAACAICLHGQTQPVIALRIADTAVEEELTENGIEIAPGTLLARSRIVLSGDITATAAFREGRVRIQDEGSQLVAEIAGQGSDILDCCAAPGGKTLILAERNPQARIVACESSAQRLESLRKRLLSLADRVECRLADAAALNDESVYDLALADVPCSGTGTLARNPEIRHRLRLEEFARQGDRQKAILTQALRAVRPGGRIVYSTCSLEPEENEQVVDAILTSHPDARLATMADRIAALQSDGILAANAHDKLREAVTPEGFLRLTPGLFATDGFFVAILERGA